MMAPVPGGLYEIRNGISDLGIPPGDHLHVNLSRKNQYILLRFISRRAAEMILSSAGVQPISLGRPLELLK